MEKENKVSCDLEKSKIEVVRDALKDAIDTIRAQDRKASYMIAIIFFLITAFVLTTLKINSFEKGISYNNLIVFFPIIYLFITVGFLFYSYNPVSNPTEVLTEEDKEFGKDKFFIFHMKDKEKDSETLASSFINATEDIKGILKILYIEILKISKIRERKISLIKQSTEILLIGVGFGFAQIITFYKFSLELFFISFSIFLFYLLCRKG